MNYIPTPEQERRFFEALGDLSRTDPTNVMYKLSQFMEKENAQGSPQFYGVSARRRVLDDEAKRRR